MKRTIIRMLGTCMATIVALGTRDSVAAIGDISYGTTNHVQYKRKQTSNGIMGLAYIWSSSAEPNCDQYKETVTTSAGGITGGEPSTSTAILCTGSDSRDTACLWCKCKSGFDPNPCGTYSYCDTGLACHDTSTWNANGASVYPKELLSAGYDYYFLGCDDGWYDTKICIKSTGEPTRSLSGCCLPCSGLKDYNPSGGTVTTFENTSDRNYIPVGTGGNKYYWVSVESGGATGIESCRGYLPESSYTDTYGTYTVAYCPYYDN